MLGLPKSTEYGRRIPKLKFYENIAVTPALKRAFTEQVEAIYWRNKIAPSTVNIAEGADVKEIEVFEIKLRAPTLNENVLRQIDGAIPYHILFVLTFDGRAQACIGYKEVGAFGNPSKVSRYYYMGWTDEGALWFDIDGLDMDAVYENLVRRIAGSALPAREGESLKDSVKRGEEKRQLEKQMAALESKMRKEIQLNKRMEIYTELKKLKKIMEGLDDGQNEI